MKFEINAGCLKTTIKALTTGGRGSDILWLNANNKGIQIRVPTREELKVSVRINNIEPTDVGYRCHEPGCVKVRAVDLNNILRQCKASQTVLIHHHTTTSMVSVLNQDIEVMIPAEEGNQLWSLASLDKPEQKFTVERDVFVNTMYSVRFAMSHEIVRPQFCGICIEASKNTLRCSAGIGSFFASKETRSKLLQNTNLIKLFLPNIRVNCILASLTALSSPILECKLFCEGTICLLTSGCLEIRIEDMPRNDFPKVSVVLEKDFSNKLCVRMSDLRPVIKSIQAVHDNAYKQGDNSLCIVDITVDANTGNMLLTWGAVARGSIPLTANTIFQNDNGSIIELRAAINNLSLICKSWRISGEITIFCDTNDTPILVKPRNKEAVRENEPDAVLSSTCKKKMSNNSPEVQK